MIDSRSYDARHLFDERPELLVKLKVGSRVFLGLPRKLAEQPAHQKAFKGRSKGVERATRRSTTMWSADGPC